MGTIYPLRNLKSLHQFFDSLERCVAPKTASTLNNVSNSVGAKCEFEFISIGFRTRWKLIRSGRTCLEWNTKRFSVSIRISPHLVPFAVAFFFLLVFVFFFFFRNSLLCMGYLCERACRVPLAENRPRAYKRSLTQFYISIARI